MDIEGRNTLQGHHDGLGAEKALNLPLVFPRHCALHGIEQRNIDFIGGFAAVGLAAHADFSTKIFHGFQETAIFLRGQQSFGGAHADAVMGGGEIKVGTADRGGGHTHHPGLEVL